MRQKILDYCRIFRWQTAPASVLLVLVPYLAGEKTGLIQTLLLGILMWLIHGFSFGNNSLLDACTIPEIGQPTYDSTDPGKAHHPLIRGAISLHEAKNVILWGLGVLAVAFVVFIYSFALNVTMALTSLFIYWVFGILYNEGLSKESLFSFLPISICFAAMAGVGWFISHESLNSIGWLYLAYAFFTIAFQTGFSGNLKELELKERSNILVKMGARIYEGDEGRGFLPGKSRFYAYLVKGSGLVLAGLLCWLNFSLVRLVVLVLLGAAVIWLLYQTTRSRVYDRPKELKWMSFMEICTIFLPIPLMLGLLEAAVLMLAGVAYFWVMNRWLWGTSYPRV